MANPSVSVESVERILEKKYKNVASPAFIKRVWKDAGLERKKGRPERRELESTKEPDTGKVEVEPLKAAGFQLVFAGEAETEAVERLVDTVMAVADDLPPPGAVPQSERELRDEKGQFTGSYNRARRTAPGELIGPAHRTASEKAEARDLGRLTFSEQQRETLDRKVWALVSLPAVTPANGRIEDLRGPQGELLGEMCGYDYQAETMRKVVSEFTVAGVGPLFQQTQSATWHKVSVERWETGYRAAVVYVDSNVKPLWTGLFTKATKVSSTGRVQPALVSTFVNTGVGVPVHFETFSGSAPLGARVLDLLERVEAENEQAVGRLTVIDGECFAAQLLLQFKERDRDLLVPIPASINKPERFRFGPGSAFRSYRDGDLIREATIELRDSKDPSIIVESRAVIIQRRTKETWTALATLAEPEEWSARALADAYFGRWPNQEGFFRRANQALGLKQVHGYGKRVVSNTAVLTKLEKLASRIELAQLKQDGEIEQLLVVDQDLKQTTKKLQQTSRYRVKREERVDDGVEAQRIHTKEFAAAVVGLRTSSEEERALQDSERALSKRRQELELRTEKRQRQLEKLEREQEKSKTRTEIIEADVAQDVLLASLKLTLGMLIHFVIVEYFGDRPVEWSTFLSRIAHLPGRRETTAETVTIFIYGNRRDIKLMRVIDKACVRINERNLVYKDKRLRYKFEWPDGIPKEWLD